MGHYVYKYVNDKDEILYIGKNDTDLVSRLKTHEYDHLSYVVKKCKIYYIEVGSVHMSEAIETLLINKYKPKYNKSKMQDCEGVEFVEPKWKLFKQCKTSICFSKDNKYSIRKGSMFYFKYNEYKNAYALPCKIVIYKNKEKVSKECYDSMHDALRDMHKKGFTGIRENDLRASMYGYECNYISIHDEQNVFLHNKKYAFNNYDYVIQCCALTPINKEFKREE